MHAQSGFLRSYPHLHSKYNGVFSYPYRYSLDSAEALYAKVCNDCRDADAHQGRPKQTKAERYLPLPQPCGTPQLRAKYPRVSVPNAWSQPRTRTHRHLPHRCGLVPSPSSKCLQMPPNASVQSSVPTSLCQLSNTTCTCDWPPYPSDSPHHATLGLHVRTTKGYFARTPYFCVSDTHLSYFRYSKVLPPTARLSPTLLCTLRRPFCPITLQCTLYLPPYLLSLLIRNGTLLRPTSSYYLNTFSVIPSAFHLPSSHRRGGNYNYTPAQLRLVRPSPCAPTHITSARELLSYL